jgi:hypothetical protein
MVFESLMQELSLTTGDSTPFNNLERRSTPVASAARRGSGSQWSG